MLRPSPQQQISGIATNFGANQPSSYAHSHHHGPHTLYQYNHAARNGGGNNNEQSQGQNKTSTLNGCSRPSSTSIMAESGAVPKEPRKRGVRLSTTGLFRIDSTCQCHDRDYPPWTGEIHGMSQALLSKSMPLRVFWWMVLVLCTSCGTATTILVIIEYIRGPTATSTTIRLVPSLELPAITVCPKVPDAFNFQAMFNDLRGVIPNIDENTARDLISFWIGGSGLENMDGLPDFNQTYVDELAKMYEQWRQGIDTKTFFQSIHAKFGYKCEDLFNNCELGGKPHNCCDTIFHARPVMRRGLCYQTLRNINQTEADDIGRLVLEIKAPHSVTSTQYNFIQPQIIIYVNDNFEQVLDFPRFYLYPHEWNRMHFTARYIELLEHPSDCTNKLIGKDANCFVKNWLSANVIDPYNCTVPYLEEIKGISSKIQTCEPRILAADYYNAIQLVHSGSVHSQECIPGCSRWEYSVSLQQSPALQPFEHHEFNLEISFYDLQYEHVKEVYTISVPGFMSQIGGQFGFFLGLSIITMIQIVIYGLSAVITFFLKLPRKAVHRICYIFKFRNQNSAKGASQSASGSPASIRLPATTINQNASGMGGAVNFGMAETSFSGLDTLDPIPEAAIAPANTKLAEGNGSPKNAAKMNQSAENRRTMLAKTKKWMSFSIGSGSPSLNEKIEEHDTTETSVKRRLNTRRNAAAAPEFGNIGGGDGFSQY